MCAMPRVGEKNYTMNISLIICGVLISLIIVSFLVLAIKSNILRDDIDDFKMLFGQ